MKGFIALAQMADQGLVAGVEPLPRIHDQQHRVRFLDSGQGLAGHLRIYAVLVTADAARVNHHKAPATHPRLTVFTVAGQPRQVGNKCLPAAGKLVKQGRFADVGAPDEGDDGYHQSFGLIS